MITMEKTGEKVDAKKIGWLKKLGFAGFLFFLIKGILWLVLFAAVAFGLADETTVQKLKDLIPF
jgi:hypothetical protein